MIECPAGAIYAEQDVPGEQKHFIDLNKELSRKWSMINEKKDPLPDAAEWDGVYPKLEHLDRG